MTRSAAGDTWGISGPTFLVIYGVLAAVVLVACLLRRRSLVNAPLRAKRPIPDIASRPHDVAYLNEGAELAVFSALSSLRLRNLISSTAGTVQAVGRIEPGADELERAIHFTAGTPVHRTRLPMHRPVQAALAASEQRLVDAGLLLSERQRREIRSVGLWMLAVLGLGLLRLLAGIAEAKPVGLLVAAMMIVGVAALGLFGKVTRRTGLGDRALVDLQTGHHALSPASKPDWTVYGPVGAALGIGIFGTSALWASDPALADELATHRMATGGSSSGTDGGGGGDSGGGGGCGGGGCGGGCGG